jgi:hypothetical protein
MQNHHHHHYTFLNNDIKGEEKKLRTAWFNYLTLQQYELARAVIQQVFTTIDSNYALFLLKSVIEKPERFIPKPCPQLIWFCYTELCHLELQMKDKKKNTTTTIQSNVPIESFIPEYEKKKQSTSIKYSTILLEFELLIEECMKTSMIDDYGEEWDCLRNVYRSCLYSGKNASFDPTAFLLTAYGSRTKTTPNTPIDNTILTHRTMKLIQHICTVQPDLGTSLTSLLILHGGDSIQVENGSPFIIELQKSFIRIIQSYMDKEQFSNAAFFFRYIQLPPTKTDETETILNKIDSIFAQLVQLTDKEIHTLLYESLLVRDDVTLLQKFCEAQSNSFSELDMEHFFGALNTVVTPSSIDSDFWKPFVNYIRISGNHILESVLQACLDVTQARNFEKLKALLSPPHFENLKPLVILLSWDEMSNDLKARQQLMDTLWPSEALFDRSIVKDDVINYSCNELAYYLSVSWWISKQLLDIGITDSNSPTMTYSMKKANRVPKFMDVLSKRRRNKNTTNDDQKDSESIGNIALSNLSHHSILYLLLPWIPHIKENELVSILRQRAVRKGTDPTQIYRSHVRRDTEIIMVRAYTIINSVLRLIVESRIRSGTMNENTVSEQFKEVRNSLIRVSQQQISAAYILSIIENIMSLLFIRKSHLKLESMSGSIDYRFLVDQSIMKHALNTLKETMDVISEQQDNQQFMKEYEHRFNRFKFHLDDALWRFNFASSIHSTSLVQCDIVELMLASPATYLTIALKRGDFDKAKEIVQRYKSDKSLQRDVIQHQFKNFTEISIAEFMDRTKQHSHENMVQFTSMCSIVFNDFILTYFYRIC